MPLSDWVTTMSDIDSVLERLRRAFAAVSEVEAVAARSPGDRFVLANLHALKRDAEDLEKQWEDLCKDKQIEVCRYRIVPEHSDRYSLTSVSKSLLDFQELFSQIYDALKPGAKGRPRLKTRARISPGVATETKFDFGFTYPGSLGVALMVESESHLFGAKFDEAVKVIKDVISIKDQHDVREMAKTLGGAVVTKVYDWSTVNAQAGYGVDITWMRTDGTLRGGVIDASALEKVVEIIEKTSDKDTKNITVAGVLVGIDRKSRRFRFVEYNGPDFAGILDDDFPITEKWAINTRYTAKITVETVIEYATMEEKRSYKLTALKRQKTP